MEYLVDLSRISKDIEEVRSLILRELNGCLPEKLLNKGQAEILVKGKMIRTTFLLLLNEMYGGRMDSVYNIAVSLEMFHIASLIHDDIMDRAHTRRSSSTVNHLLGDTSSALVGDIIMTRSLKRMVDQGEAEVAGIIVKSGRLMIKGQLLEHDNSYNYSLKKKDYIRIIRLKTAELFSAVACIVAAGNKLDYRETERLKRFMVKTGIIFQVQDDLIDIRSGVSGKERFIDWREGKVTLPYILLGEAETGIFEKREGINEELLERKFREYRIYETVESYISEYLMQCREFLNSFKESECINELMVLINILSERNY